MILKIHHNTYFFLISKEMLRNSCCHVLIMLLCTSIVSLKKRLDKMFCNVKRIISSTFDGTHSYVMFCKASNGNRRVNSCAGLRPGVLWLAALFETLLQAGQKENVSAHSCLSDSTSESHGQHAESSDIIALPCPQPRWIDVERLSKVLHHCPCRPFTPQR